MYSIFSLFSLKKFLSEDFGTCQGRKTRKKYENTKKKLNASD